ncbi:uncharacterized protein Dyak_GE27388 [Drosophila yakuba]|uniref:Uncharacterized protein n=1 Tax=Drosophila yakuba TaxID=7245 RepID=A0A0R1E4F3_DROYA|nr:uncharacterized protein Dyak_GE27388 [Drosophila yakuba]
MQRPVWACTIKVSVAAMSEDPAPRLPSSSIREPLSLFPARHFHTSNAMYYSDLFCQPIKPKPAAYREPQVLRMMLNLSLSPSLMPIPMSMLHLILMRLGEPQTELLQLKLVERDESFADSMYQYLATGLPSDPPNGSISTRTHTHGFVGVVSLAGLLADYDLCSAPK